MWPSTRLDVLARSTPEGRGIRPCRELAQMQAREGGLWAAENDGAAAQDLPSRGRADRRDVDHCHDHVQLGAHAHTGASGMKRSVQSRASNSPGPTELCPTRMSRTNDALRFSRDEARRYLLSARLHLS